MIGGNLKIENVSKNFGKFQVLKNVSLEVKKGEFFSILGPSGCGKTTLLRLIGGFEYPDSGNIILDNEKINDVAPNKRPVNTVFQNYALFPHYNVFDNIAFSLRIKKIQEHIIKQKVSEYVELVQLQDHIKKFPSQLSGGQKQRVAIARALINEPKILLLDEPLSALDAKLRQQLLIDLDDLHDKIGITFIYVTHDQQEAMSVSDRLVIINEGEILQIGTPQEIYESPINNFVATFIGESNILNGKVIEIYNEIAKISVNNLNYLYVYLDKPLKIGDNIDFTIRPEKIRITKERPDELEYINILKGKVDELIYSGFQTKFFIDINKQIFRVFKQHIQYFMDETPINWKDEVYIWWYPNDSFIVEVK